MPQLDLDPPEMQRERALMVSTQLRIIGDPRVKQAMAVVPRHLFVPANLRRVAYADGAFPIGHAQTISQPLMVATMLEAAELRDTDRVLDVGAGCGYQAAVIAQLVREVHTIEIITELAERASRNLERAGISNVHVVLGDGSRGLPEHAPYDAIIVAAGAKRVPAPLVEQLTDGGRLIIPVKSIWGEVLRRIRKGPDGITSEKLCGCRFVPLVMD